MTACTIQLPDIVEYFTVQNCFNASSAKKTALFSITIIYTNAKVSHFKQKHKLHYRHGHTYYYTITKLVIIHLSQSSNLYIVFIAKSIEQNYYKCIHFQKRNEVLFVLHCMCVEVSCSAPIAISTLITILQQSEIEFTVRYSALH